MNFLGIGAPEMAIIAVVALLVFGPGKLPEVMGQVGRAIRQFKDMTAQLSGEFEKTIAEAQEMGRSFTEELGLGDMQKQVSSMTESVRKELSGVSSSGTASSSSTSAAESTTTEEQKPMVLGRSRALSAMSANAATATHTNVPDGAEPIVVASKADPVSDFSLFTPEPDEKPHRVRRLMTTTTPLRVATSEPPVANGDGVDGEQDETSRQDALERARKRRLAAGYNRHIA